MKMLKKKAFWFLAANFLLLPHLGASAAFAQNHPAMALMGLYAGEVRNERTLNPYFLNIIAIHELSRGRNVEKVGRYLEWYFAHLNYPDLDGLTGTIYDYELTDAGKERSRNQYDSVDGYAGTFLFLLNLYDRQSGDRSLVKKYWSQIKDIAYLIPYLQGEDGLTKFRFKAGEGTRYLMDNCEAYAGITAFQELSGRAGDRWAAQYKSTGDDIREGVLDRMYNHEAGNFYWAVDDRVKHPADWEILYPDALAQIFPLYYGLLSPREDRAKKLWQEFNKRHGHKNKGFPLEQRMIYNLTKEKMTGER
jgi:hypothetical protein